MPEEEVTIQPVPNRHARDDCNSAVEDWRLKAEAAMKQR
eukprot:CAMPEP_0179154554 /NCGR_PEP_ID=MMETSP0796-20121207/75228_1 /TAXON_ID=73915 /ORGANISM="Pyrodinium bahamense, Strain pbaha01" /LENGTH=38 /DNA_ID= /DNA_START= /DNA_END= /DNA_ORIENTATION=